MSNFWEELVPPFLVLAPMDNVTDVAFREVLTILPRPDVFFTEFTNVTSLNSAGRERALERLKFANNQRPIVAQIWGINPDHFFLSAQLVQELGFDGVDINMGCPNKDVMKGGAGSALIKNSELATKIIEAVKRGAPNLPISVKTRLGYDKVITEQWAEILLKQNLAALTIHGRIATEMSKFPADWDEIAKVVKLRDKLSPQTLIVGNGDVANFAQAVEYHQQYGVDGVMIGRGLFANPWVFEKTKQLHTPSKEECLNILLKHVELHQERWSVKRFDQLKKFFKMYLKGFPGANRLRTQLMDSHSGAQVVKIIESERK